MGEQEECGSPLYISSLPSPLIRSIPLSLSPKYALLCSSLRADQPADRPTELYVSVSRRCVAALAVVVPEGGRLSCHDRAEGYWQRPTGDEGLLRVEEEVGEGPGCRVASREREKRK